MKYLRLFSLIFGIGIVASPSFPLLTPLAQAETCLNGDSPTSGKPSSDSDADSEVEEGEEVIED
jgi:hypothetical protein